MPVTIKLSKLFHERLGEELANELVGWFNQVDATYRIELREFNDANFARFEAKLEQRLAEFHAKLDAKIERVAADLSAKLDTKAERTALAELSAKLDAKLDRVTAAEMFAQLGARITESEARMDAKLADLRAVLERRLGEQTRWLVVTWATLLIPIVGLWFRG